MLSIIVKSWNFTRDRYIYHKDPPHGIQHDLKLSLDEFYLFDPSINVDKISSRQKTASSVPIERACRSMRRKHGSQEDPAYYSVCLSLNEEINQTIDLPRVIREKSFYEKYWPSDCLSNFFKYRNKLFHAYQEGYKSHPYIPYGGLTEWLYIISGSITVTLIQPTTKNLCKYSALSDDDSLEPEADTVNELLLKEGNFLVIPAGWISIREANRTTFAFGGELLHDDNIIGQLDAFNNDLAGLTSSCDPSCLEKDAEIRYMYWFYAIHLLNRTNALKHSIDVSIECLKSHLEQWKNRSAKLIRSKEPYVKPTAFVPPGIKADIIVKDLQARQSQFKRRSFKGTKDPIDVPKSHLGVDD
uniref:Histone lysine demethylase PHF8 n=1 Tax=Aceria tosichella TaxID=561515 RepID=A0A6G1S6I4_9ACAR